MEYEFSVPLGCNGYTTAGKNGIVNSAMYRPVLVGERTKNTKFLEERRQRAGRKKREIRLTFFRLG